MFRKMRHQYDLQIGMYEFYGFGGDYHTLRTVSYEEDDDNTIYFLFWKNERTGEKLEKVHSLSEAMDQVPLDAKLYVKDKDGGELLRRVHWHNEVYDTKIYILIYRQGGYHMLQGTGPGSFGFRPLSIRGSPLYRHADANTAVAEALRYGAVVYELDSLEDIPGMLAEHARNENTRA